MAALSIVRQNTRMTPNTRSCVIASCALLAATLAGCRALSQAARPAKNPAAGEVRLGTSAGFDAYLVHQSDVGIWTVACLPILERYGCPEIVALDDRGRCTVLMSYSGTWAPWIAVQDGLWLGGIAHADVDSRRTGNELYVGGQRGSIYQIWPHPEGGFDTNMIAYLPGREIYTLVAADLDRARTGVELLAFTRPGGLYMLEPTSELGGTFTCRLLGELPGRVRDAVVLEGLSDGTCGIATVSRAGEVGLLRMMAGKPAWTTLYKTSMGLGRIAAKPRSAGEPVVLYVTCDDGQIIRLEERDDGSFQPELVYAGPQGPRGIVAGRFHADPQVESIAVFGYSKKVQLLTREERGWRVETIFEDLDKGHWLAVGELDGRNATDEIILSGYGARVVLLARPPGYGITTGAATDQ